ncbi:hypothetical protein B0H13DRAFT_1874834 [Mycena leptocephala]|nr:hypothetical protein B0H13DRAFT_1874834 [Mycena leptocephala]
MCSVRGTQLFSLVVESIGFRGFCWTAGGSPAELDVDARTACAGGAGVGAMLERAQAEAEKEQAQSTTAVEGELKRLVLVLICKLGPNQLKGLTIIILGLGLVVARVVLDGKMRGDGEEISDCDGELSFDETGSNAGDGDRDEESASDGGIGEHTAERNISTYVNSISWPGGRAERGATKKNPDFGAAIRGESGMGPAKRKKKKGKIQIWILALGLWQGTGFPTMPRVWERVRGVMQLKIHVMHCVQERWGTPIKLDGARWEDGQNAPQDRVTE